MIGTYETPVAKVAYSGPASGVLPLHLIKPEHLSAYLWNSVSGLTRALSRGTDFQATITDDAKHLASYAVTVDDPGFDYVVFQRTTPDAQGLSVLNGNPSDIHRYELALDAAECEIQELAVRGLRALRVGPAETTPPPGLPAIALRRLRCLRFSADGLSLVAEDIAPPSGVLVPFLADATIEEFVEDAGICDQPGPSAASRDFLNGGELQYAAVGSLPGGNLSTMISAVEASLVESLPPADDVGQILYISQQKTYKQVFVEPLWDAVSCSAGGVGASATIGNGAASGQVSGISPNCAVIGVAGKWKTSVAAAQFALMQFRRSIPYLGTAYNVNAASPNAILSKERLYRTLLKDWPSPWDAWVGSAVAAPNAWVSVCWSPSRNLFCAISSDGSGNRVMTSPDGVTWTIRTSAADNNWTSVCWSPELGIFCAVANSGTGNRVMTSSDGITWTIRTSSADNMWSSVCWSPSLAIFCAVATTGTGTRVMTSPNGTTWTTRTSAADIVWTSVCWSPERSMFVAVANTGTGNRVMTSYNGTTWTIRTSAADNQWMSVCWSPELGLFCAVASTGTGNRVMTSPDGITWTTRTSPIDNSWYSVCWAPEIGMFCAVAVAGSGDLAMVSRDGITWMSVGCVSGTWTSICWSPSKVMLCAVSNGGSGKHVMISGSVFV